MTMQEAADLAVLDKTGDQGGQMNENDLQLAKIQMDGEKGDICPASEKVVKGPCSDRNLERHMRKRLRSQVPHRRQGGCS